MWYQYRRQRTTPIRALWVGLLDYIGNNVILTEGALKNSLHHLFHHREIKA
jgi:hypothetical protein